MKVPFFRISIKFSVDFAADSADDNMGSNNGNESRMDKNPPDYIILAKWIFEIFILAVKPFVKALRIFEACVLVNNNLCEKISFIITDNIWQKI